MSQQHLSLGSGPNSGDGGNLRAEMEKVEANFTDLYAKDLLKAPLASPVFTGAPKAPLLDLTEQVSPGSPAANALRLYSYDTGNGISNFAAIDAAGTVTPLGPQNHSTSMAGYFPNLSDPEVQSVTLLVGVTYLYTVPAGRKAILSGIQWSNGATADGYFVSAFIGGADRTISGGSIGAAANTYGTPLMLNGANGLPVLLGAGEKAGMEVAGVGGVTTMMLASMYAIEFDASSPLTAATIVNFTGGGTFDDWLVVAAGYRTSIGVHTAGGATPSTQALGYVNRSGASRTITVRKVSSTGVTVTILSATVLNGGAISRGLGGGLGPGGKIQIASDSNAAGQFAQIIHTPRKIS